VGRVPRTHGASCTVGEHVKPRTNTCTLLVACPRAQQSGYLESVMGIAAPGSSRLDLAECPAYRLTILPPLPPLCRRRAVEANAPGIGYRAKENT